MVDNLRLLPAVHVEIFQNGRVWQAFEAKLASDLNVRFELMTGSGWLELMPHYLHMVEHGLDKLIVPDRVCHSYEKWGDWQQEVKEVEVRMQCLREANAVGSAVKRGQKKEEGGVERNDERVDCRAEWYRDFDPLAASKPRIPGIYWLGMLASAIWLVAYLLIYPSIPLPGGHWRGLGEPGGCQPWTAICEQAQKQAALDALREPYLRKIKAMPLEAITEDVELRDFIAFAARTPYVERCAGCHGEGKSKLPIHGNAAAIYNAIVTPAKHPFGLSAHLNDAMARMVAVYAWQQPR